MKKMAEYFLHKGSPTYLQDENADVMSISQFMAQNLRQPPPPAQPKHTFEISEGESVEIEKIVAAEKKVFAVFTPSVLFPCIWCAQCNKCTHSPTLYIVEKDSQQQRGRLGLFLFRPLSDAVH